MTKKLYLLLCVGCLSAPLAAQGPYPYYGGPSQAPDNPAPQASPDEPPPQQQEPPPPPPPPPPRRVYYRARAVAYDPGPALAPYPWSFNFGGGPTAVSGPTDQLTSGANFTVGMGGNFDENVGLNLEFMNTSLGLTDSDLAQNQANDGSAHIWSLTLDPIYRYKIAGIMGGYLIGGGGYYHRQLRYDQVGFVPFFGPVDEITQVDTDAGGLNAGAGFTFNFGWGTKFYVEARYHYIFTPGTATRIIPITFGLRW